VDDISAHLKIRGRSYSDHTPIHTRAQVRRRESGPDRLEGSANITPVSPSVDWFTQTVYGSRSPAVRSRSTCFRRSETGKLKTRQTGCLHLPPSRPGESAACGQLSAGHRKQTAEWMGILAKRSHSLHPSCPGSRFSDRQTAYILLPFRPVIPPSWLGSQRLAFFQIEKKNQTGGLTIRLSAL